MQKGREMGEEGFGKGKRREVASGDEERGRANQVLVTFSATTTEGMRQLQIACKVGM